METAAYASGKISTGDDSKQTGNRVEILHIPSASFLQRMIILKTMDLPLGDSLFCFLGFVSFQ
jgi:hypothetical protein